MIDNLGVNTGEVNITNGAFTLTDRNIAINANGGLVLLSGAELRIPNVNSTSRAIRVGRHHW